MVDLHVLVREIQFSLEIFDFCVCVCVCFDLSAFTSNLEDGFWSYGSLIFVLFAFGSCCCEPTTCDKVALGLNETGPL